MMVLTESGDDEKLIFLQAAFTGQTNKFLTQFTNALGSLFLSHGKNLMGGFTPGRRHHIGQFFDAGFEFFHVFANRRNVGFANRLLCAGIHFVKRNTQRFQTLVQVLGLCAQSPQALFKVRRRAVWRNAGGFHPGSDGKEANRNGIKGIGYLCPADGRIYRTSNDDSANYGDP